MNVTRVKQFILRDMAITHNREKLTHNENVEVTDERFLLIVGSESTGKTSLINQIFQTDKGLSKPTSSTYLLEYKYGIRRTGMESLVGNMCHTWELGSGTTFVSLLPAIVKSQQPSSVVLLLDLTSSELIAETAETLLNILRSLLTDSSENENKALNESIQEGDALERPFPIPLIIIGGKYDLFQNFESAKKRVTCLYLQCLAQIQRADLLFYSLHDNKLVKNVREVLLQHAFGIRPVNSKNNSITDYNKPLYILTDHHPIRNSEYPSITSEYHSLNKHKNDLLQMAHFNHQQPNQRNALPPEDPAKDTNFIEHVIDNLCAQKQEELKKAQEESRRKVAAIESMRAPNHIIPTHID